MDVSKTVAGWQLVPVEPTSDMIAAYVAEAVVVQLWDDYEHVPLTGDAETKMIYAAMLAAAPTPPALAPVAPQAASEREAELLAALEGAVAVIKDYLEYDHNGDPWTEDARTMGEMDINDYQHDGRLEVAQAAIDAARGAK